MSNTIQIKRSSTAAAVPTAGQLAVGELAVNLVDKRLFTKDAVGAVVDLTAPTIPAGSVIHVAMSTAPSGYLQANGALVSRTTYAALFTAIGTTFGAGDGSTTFAVPDLREAAVVGIGTRGTTAPDTYTLGEFKNDQMQGHGHDDIRLDGGSQVGDAVNGTAGVTGLMTIGGTGNRFSMRGTISNTVNGTPRIGDTTRGKRIGLLACIKF
jgi:hypothetical protein